MKVFIFVDQSVKFNLMSASSLINSHFIKTLITKGSITG